MYKKLYLNLGRSSLRYIIRAYKIREINIPFYLCDEIRHCIVRENCKPVFYHIDDNFLPVKNFDKNEYILYPNYFGICDKNVEYLESVYPKLIVDNAHSFYSEPKGFACFNSARKFLPVHNGSVLQIRKTVNDYKTEEYQPFFNNEEYKLKRELLFSQSEPAFICKKAQKEIENINNMSERKNKFIALNEKYKSENLLNIDISSSYSPFCYPLLLKDKNTADKYADILIKKGYNIYRYWNNLPEIYKEYVFYRNLIPIPLDK